MRDDDACELPYICRGDVTVCRLPHNHEHDCTEANRRADDFRASLHERTRAALNEGWL